MLLYVRLCVDLRDSQSAKDGLHQFRPTATQQMPVSLEKVVRHYLMLADKKCQEAKKESERKAHEVTNETADLDDLDSSETPEM